MRDETKRSVVRERRASVRGRAKHEEDLIERGIERLMQRRNRTDRRIER